MHAVSALLVFSTLATLSTNARSAVVYSSELQDGHELQRGNSSALRNAGADTLLRSNSVGVFAYYRELPRSAQWALSENGTTSIRSLEYNKCLDVDAQSSSPRLSRCNEKLSQQWRLVDTDSYELKRIQSVQSSLYLDQVNADINGFPVMSEFNSSRFQMWAILSVEDVPSQKTGRLQMAWPSFPENSIHVWPNPNSTSNTDPYLRDNHNSISQLRPRVLVVSPLDMSMYSFGDILAKAQNLAIGFAEGSRYHGYKNPEAPVFLRYVIDKVVLLNDKSSISLSWGDFQEPYYPQEFFSDSFADLMGYRSKDGLRNLTMCELFQQGAIHELWLAGWPAEFLSYAPLYTEDLVRSSFDTCAGNGCLTNGSAVEYCNVTVRIAGLTMDRGLGCSVHNQGHGLERLRSVNRYLGKQSQRFFNEDLKKNVGAPFDSLYSLPSWDPACPNPLFYESSTDVRATFFQSSIANASSRPPSSSNRACGNASVKLHNIWKGCGNVHFSPNSRFQYDADFYRLGDPAYGPSAVSVQNTCENYGLHNDASGKDKVTEYSYFSTKVYYYDLLGFDDCEGGWNIYLRQNMPGFQNKAFLEGSGYSTEPYMRNWWPFMFY